jgi:hypothetical protein
MADRVADKVRDKACPPSRLWHVNCSRDGRTTLMAAKLIMLKFLQETQVVADFTNRRPQLRSNGLALIALRSNLVHIRLPPRRRNIAIDVQEFADLPCPVKITHLSAAPAPRASL